MGYEWRFQSPSVLDQIGRWQFDPPRWDGSPLDGGRVFIHCEQGVGDVTQMARYLRQTIEQGRPVLECQPDFVRLLNTRFDSIAEVVARRDDGHRLHDTRLLPAYHEPIRPDRHEPRNDPEDRSLYHSAHGACRALNNATWRKRIGRRPGLDEPPQPLQRPAARLPPGRFFTPCRRAGVRFFALQKSDAAAQASQPPDGLAIEPLYIQLDDFADTAGAVANLDLVISVDAAVVYLAGAMGRPVWTLLPQLADWRWLIECEDSPWYPSMQLIRQRNASGWRAPRHTPRRVRRCTLVVDDGHAFFL